MARPGTRENELCGGTSDGVAVNANGAQAWFDQPAHLQIAEADDGDGLIGGGTHQLQSSLSQA